jgi:hypothetical protein
MFCVSSASAGDHQSMPLFYCDRGAKQSADHGSPKVTKNLKVAGFEVTLSGRFCLTPEG